MIWTFSLSICLEFFGLVAPLSAHTNHILNTDCMANRKYAFCMGNTRIPVCEWCLTDDTPPLGNRKQKVPQKTDKTGNVAEKSHSSSTFNFNYLNWFLLPSAQCLVLVALIICKIILVRFLSPMCVMLFEKIHSQTCVNENSDWQW